MENVLQNITVLGECFTEPTVGKHAGRGELDVGQGPEVVQHGTAVALFLRVIHKGANVVLLAVVPNARADNHGDFHCRETRYENMTASNLHVGQDL